MFFSIGGGLFGSRLKTQFFPEDVQYWFYLDIWLPNDAPLSATNDAAVQAEEVVRKVIETSPELGSKDERGHLLKSLTTFTGGGGPRFWFSVSPEMPQTNYAQMIVEVTDKEATPKLKRPIQDALAKQIPGAWITVRQLQTNPVENPVELMISGQADVDAKNEARRYSYVANDRSPGPGHRSQGSRAFPFFGMTGFRTMFSYRIQIDPDRANVAGHHQRRCRRARQARQ